MGKKPQKKQHQTADDDNDLHANMLAQLGLKADTKEGKEMLGVLKKKLNKTGGNDEGWQEAAASSDGEPVGGEEYDDGKLTLGDLFTSIDKSKQTTASKQNQDEVINTNRLQKQLKSLRKEAQVTALTAPLSGRKRLKLERQENYEQVKKQVSRFIPQVKHNREADQIDFTTRDVIGEGGGVRLNSLNQIASNLRESQATTSLEK